MATLAFHPLAVADVRRDTDEAVVVTFDVPDALAPQFAFAAGQHLTLRARLDGAEVRRSYSICSPAGGPLRVGIRHQPGGRFSGWANTGLRPGDVLDVMAPTGAFTVHPDPSARRHVVALAAGSGITPVLSIVQTVLEGEPQSLVTLLVVNRRVSTTMLLEELQALKDRHLPRFQLWFAFTREPGDVDLLSGRPDPDRLARLVEAGVLPAGADATYLCGPIDLVDSARRVLVERGTAPASVHTELFGAPVAVVDEHAAGTGAVVTATLAGRTSTFAVAPGETILAAARRERPDVPFSCTAGVCATCRARLLVGTVDLAARYGLTDEELGAGYVLTCQSRPTAPSVTVDYDA